MSLSNPANPLKPSGGSNASGVTTVPVKAPIGCIVWWSGTVANIPTGWHICDGTGGTIDLRDKFVLAAGTNHAVGDTGGSEEVTLTEAQLPKHSHDIRTSNNIPDVSTTSSSVGPGASSGGTTLLPNIVGTTGNNQPHPNMPPYYTLIAIQKIAADETDAADISFDDTMTETDGVYSVTRPVHPVLTQAEYDALPEDERNRGLYVIKGMTNSESNGSSDSSSREVYSEEETVIGTWLGKPLYRKVAAFTMSNPTAGTEIRVPLDNTVQVKSFSTFVTRTDGWILTAPNAEPNDFAHQINVKYCPNPTGMTVWCGNAFTSYLKNTPCWMIVEYTKTTD